MLKEVIKKTDVRLALAADINQSIHRAYQELACELLNSCEQRYELTYCYRATRQILSSASNWLSKHTKLSKANVREYGLSGLDVKFIEVDNLKMQVSVCKDIVKDLEARYEKEEIAVIFCQYFNPSFNKVSDEETALKSCSTISPHYKFASVTKGFEYFSGVIFISENFMAFDMKRGNILRANTLYVSLTRFRQEVTVTLVKHAAVANHLREVSQGLRRT